MKASHTLPLGQEFHQDTNHDALRAKLIDDGADPDSIAFEVTTDHEKGTHSLVCTGEKAEGDAPKRGRK